MRRMLTIEKTISAIWLLVAAFVAGCGADRDLVDVSGFDPLANYKSTESLPSLSLDYRHAIDSGFMIPAAGQTPTGLFSYKFSVSHRQPAPLQLYYKIYYQNESYKYPEVLDDGSPNPLAAENFYGSWEDVSAGFVSAGKIPHTGEPHLIEGEFRILGNPRSEERYFGTARMDREISEDSIRSLASYIVQDEQWLGTIREKARRNKITLEEQLRLDALFVLEEKRTNTILNNRWKRNPRTGRYSFLLVVTTADDLAKIPEPVQYINQKLPGGFVNPYEYFLYGEGAELSQTVVIKSGKFLQVTAAPRLADGVYISAGRLEGPRLTPRRDCMTGYCNDSEGHYNRAAFEQFFHYTHDEMNFRAVPTVMDVAGTAFTQATYDSLKQYGGKSLVPASITNSDCPCQSVRFDSASQSISLLTLPPDSGRWNRKNAGLVSRHGFTYGKFTARVKFPELLNAHNMWNGLTNAFWMINESLESWNYLRPCDSLGYIPKHFRGKEKGRAAVTGYSEIDIEIRKASPRWPVTSYSSPDKRPPLNPDDTNKIVVTCTNWDLACADPENFGPGIRRTNYEGIDYFFHRWNHDYQAVTAKYVVADDELFASDYFYYQIDWRPDTIIWRIGPGPDRLKVIGFLDQSSSSIPNNQMFMVFTQEFHPSVWWPESPQELEYIPFPSRALEGRILEVTIE